MICGPLHTILDAVEWVRFPELEQEVDARKRKRCRFAFLPFWSSRENGYWVELDEKPQRDLGAWR